MVLQVLGSPHVDASTSKQKVIVTYDHARELTIVDCDVDIVTLGIAVNVLQKQYQDYLGKLDLSLARQINETTMKAVLSNGQN